MKKLHKPLKRIGLFLKPGAPKAHALAAEVAGFLAGRGLYCVAVQHDDTPPLPCATLPAEEVVGAVDVLLVIGGDGTFLAAARAAYGTGTPLAGINLGRLGFLTEMNPTALPQALEAYLNGHYCIEERAFFEASLVRGRKTVWRERFLNDAVVQRNANEKMLSFEVEVDGRLMGETTADGMIVATPTGSTAYNLSTGGPIVVPTLPCLVLSPICPHRLTFRPVVVPTVPVRIHLQSNQGHLSIDGRYTQQMLAGDYMQINHLEHSIKVLHNPDANFFDLLRDKLGWNSLVSHNTEN